MELNYSNKVPKCHFTIKCIPSDTVRQKMSNVEFQLSPNVSFSNGIDSFRNSYIFGCVDKLHDKFSFHITGIAENSDSYECEADNTAMMYSHPYGLNIPGGHLRKYYASFEDELNGTAYEKAEYIMNKLHNDFIYESGSTNINTSAENALKQGRGVCQDYAHIMISLCQLAGIGARYVCGLMLGEGQSHAWVEILHENKWYGMDPTHNLLIDGQYIKLGCGRDASDCQINRGIICGNVGTQTQTIFASVKEI